MAENTLQYEWIVTLKGGIDTLITDFVAGDLFWYPVRGEPQTVQAPDVMVALGRPKGHRPSYKQWEEGNVAPQVVFELPPLDYKLPEMLNKILFYQKYGVEEYYILNPDQKVWLGYRRVGDDLVEILGMDGFVSPRLGIRFAYEGDEPVVYRPDGGRFRTFAELSNAEAEQRARADALAERLRALGVEV